MDNHFAHIYNNDAARYDAMVSCEDYQGNILPALQKICPLDSLDVVEFGAGTGRLTKLILPHARFVQAFDAAEAMLAVGREKLATVGENWSLEQGDHRHLPVKSHTADLALAGWTLSFFTESDTWQVPIGAAVEEMQRVTKPGGTVIIIETLGTGDESPNPPSESLAAYYDWLENEHGFSRNWIRTDYQFKSVEQADGLTRFFFGDDLADRIQREQLTIVPECTGIWWKHV